MAISKTREIVLYVVYLRNAGRVNSNENRKFFMASLNLKKLVDPDSRLSKMKVSQFNAMLKAHKAGEEHLDIFQRIPFGEETIAEASNDRVKALFDKIRPRPVVVPLESLSGAKSVSSQANVDGKKVSVSGQGDEVSRFEVHGFDPRAKTSANVDGKKVSGQGGNVSRLGVHGVDQQMKKAVRVDNERPPVSGQGVDNSRLRTQVDKQTSGGAEFDVHAYASEMRLLNAELASKNTELDILKKERESHMTSTQTLVSQNTNLRKELQVKRDENDTFMQKMKQLEADNKKMRNELAMANAEKGRLKDVDEKEIVNFELAGMGIRLVTEIAEDMGDDNKFSRKMKDILITIQKIDLDEKKKAATELGWTEGPALYGEKTGDAVV